MKSYGKLRSGKGETREAHTGPEGSPSDCVDTSHEQVEMSTQDNRISQISENNDEPWT